MESWLVRETAVLWRVRPNEKGWVTNRHYSLTSVWLHMVLFSSLCVFHKIREVRGSSCEVGGLAGLWGFTNSTPFSLGSFFFASFLLVPSHAGPRSRVGGGAVGFAGLTGGNESWVMTGCLLMVDHARWETGTCLCRWFHSLGREEQTENHWIWLILCMIYLCLQAVSFTRVRQGWCKHTVVSFSSITSVTHNKFEEKKRKSFLIYSGAKSI